MSPILPKHRVNKEWLMANYCSCGHHLLAHHSQGCTARGADGKVCRCMKFEKSDKERWP